MASENVDWFGTVRARVGLLPLNNLLLFASGGLAYGKVGTQVGLNSPITEVNGSGNSYNCTNSGGTGTNCFLGNSSRIQAGFAVGTGAEYLIWHNVSVKAEYLYVNLGPGHATNVVAQATFGPSPRRHSRPATAWLISMWSGAGSTGNSVRRCAFVRPPKTRHHLGKPIGPALRHGCEALTKTGFAVDYLEARDAETLVPVGTSRSGKIRLLVAAKIGTTRLIDNVGV